MVEDIESERVARDDLESGSPVPVSQIKRNLMQPSLNLMQIQEVGYQERKSSLKKRSRNEANNPHTLSTMPD